MSIASLRLQSCVLFFLAAVAGAQTMPENQPTLWSAKPDLAAFEKLEDTRIANAQKSIDQVTAATGARTIENTLAPYDEAVRQLNAAVYFSSLMQQVHPDAAFRDHATAMTTKVSSALTALSLNRDVYKALAALDVSKADAPTRYYVHRQLLEFRLAGVDKDDATREKLHKLQDKLTEDQSMFDRNITDDVRSVEVTDAAELDGMPQDYIDQHKPGTNGKIHVTTDYPDIFPALKFAKSDALRRNSGRLLPRALIPRIALCLRT